MDHLPKYEAPSCTLLTIKSSIPHNKKSKETPKAAPKDISSSLSTAASSVTKVEPTARKRSNPISGQIFNKNNSNAQVTAQATLKQQKEA